MITVQDEILNGNPSFRITDNTNGQVIHNNVTIEMITEILQSGTPIAKALFDSIAKDFSDIINGVTVVGKSRCDENGLNIDEKYAKKNEIPIVDQEIDEESTNAISNKAVYEALENVTIDMDEVPTEGSMNAVTSGGLYIVIGNVESLLSQI